MATLAHIESLLEKNRYSEDNLPELENFVMKQVSDRFYFFESNLATLKLYQFNPTVAKKEIVAFILGKALMNLPSTDFSMCLHLISDKLLKEEPLSSLVSVGRHLEACQFKMAWELFESKEDSLPIPGFTEAIRNFIAGILTLACARIETLPLAEALNLSPEGTELAQFIAAKAWIVDDAGVVTLTDHVAAAPALARAAGFDIMNPEQITRVLSSM